MGGELPIDCFSLSVHWWKEYLMSMERPIGPSVGLSLCRWPKPKFKIRPGPAWPKLIVFGQTVTAKSRRWPQNQTPSKLSEHSAGSALSTWTSASSALSNIYVLGNKSFGFWCYLSFEFWCYLSFDSCCALAVAFAACVRQDWMPNAMVRNPASIGDNPSVAACRSNLGKSGIFFRKRDVT